MISVNTDKEFVIAIMDASISINNADSVRNELKKATTANSGMDIVIDLAQVNFLDSSAIAMFVNFVQSMAGSRKKMSFINVAPSIRNTIKVLNLTKFLNIK
jgi:anti-anti-sigma factor